jgi:hypothetical protein
MDQMLLDIMAKAQPTDLNQSDVLVDTNVMMEVYTIADLVRAGDALQDLNHPTYQYRRMRARHSTILAWWLGKKDRRVGLLGMEVVTMLKKLAPEADPDLWVFTRAIVRVAAPMVMRLKAGPLTEVDHNLTGTNADKQILAQAAGANLPLITHEGLTDHGVEDVGLRARAKNAGVSVFTAEEYLRAEGVDVDQECREFIVACRAAVAECAAQKVLEGDRALSDLTGLYRHILNGEVSAP